MTIYERIKTTAEQKGFALSELARRAGIGEKSIYAWKPSEKFPNGITPKRSTLEKVAEVLGVSVDYLLGNEDIISTTTIPQETQPVDLDQLLSNEGMAMFDGQPLSEEYKKALLAMLNTMKDNEN